MGNLPPVCAASVTPVDVTGSVDIPKLAAHCRWLLDNGCDGIVLFGTTGEAASFGIGERQAVLEAMLASGIQADQLVIGTGCCSVEDTVVLSRHALQQGCAGVLVHPPYFFRPASDAGILAFFVGVVEALGNDACGLILYHFPEATGAPISQTLIRQLTDRYPDVFVGIKDSTGRLEDMLAVVQWFPELKVFTGDDHLLWPLLEAGGHGAITATANLVPNLLAQVREDWSSKSEAVCNAHENLSLLWENVLLKFPVSEAVKDVIASVSGDEGWRALRPPLSPLSAPRRAQLSQLTAPFEIQFPEGLGREA